MKTIYKQSFERDIKKIKKKKIKKGLLNLIIQIKEFKNMTEIKNLKKIKGDKGFYRVKVGDYRLGIKIEADTVTCIRFLHRKEIYIYFP